MKLLLVFILFLIFLILDSGIGRELKEDITVAEPMPEQQEMLFARNTELRARDWYATCMFIREITGASVNQGDIPDDQGGHIHGWGAKAFFKYNGLSVLAGQMQALYSQKFMRLLSARHINGFYIYSLEKLII